MPTWTRPRGPAVPAPGARAAWNRVADSLSRWVSDSLLALCARLALAAIFFLSGRTKVEGLLTVSDGAYALFRDEYKVPLLAPEVAAHLATYAEHLLPVLLVLGLFTRLSALGLLAMTAVIQFFVYPDAWPTHLSWAALALYLVGRGGGALSLDRSLGIPLGPLPHTPAARGRPFPAGMGREDPHETVKRSTRSSSAPGRPARRSRRAAQGGLRIAIVERNLFGGTCVNTGCMPTKTLVASARAAHVARRAAEFGVSAPAPSASTWRASRRARTRRPRNRARASRRGCAGSRRPRSSRARALRGPPRWASRGGSSPRRASSSTSAAAPRARAAGHRDVPFLTNASMMVLDRCPSTSWSSAAATSGSSSRRCTGGSGAR